MLSHMIGSAGSAGSAVGLNGLEVMADNSLDCIAVEVL